jgi:hypothetical protein
MAGVREWFNGPGGKIIGIVIVLLGVVAVVVGVKNIFGPDEAAQLANTRWFVDSKDGKAYRFELSIGTPIPAPAPSGGNTGFPAELCYWTKDGKPKADPTPVLLNQLVGKPEPTFCPDCGRLVRTHNPGAAEGQTPPPTESEYKAKGGNNTRDPQSDR